MSRCFAYNVQRQRCDQEGGHDGDHSISLTWTDEESWDPNDLPVPYVAPMSGGTVVPTTSFTATRSVATLRSVNEDGEFFDTQIDVDDNALGETGKCFSCGCAEDDHPCDAHGCRSYVA
jgi:hypothetical protein